MYFLNINYSNRSFLDSFHSRIGLLVDNPENPSEDRKKCKLCIIQTGCLSVEKYKNDTLACIDTLGRQCSQQGIPYYMAVSGVPDDLKWLLTNPLCKTNLQVSPNGLDDIEYDVSRICINLDEKQDEKFVNILDFSNIIHDKDGSGSYKLFYGLKKVIEDYDAEVIWMLDGDCVVNIKNTFRLIEQIDINHNFHIGNNVYGLSEFDIKGRMHHGGCGYMITRYTANKIYGHLQGFQERWETNYCDLVNRDFYKRASDVAFAILVSLISCDHLSVTDNVMTSEYNLFSEEYRKHTGNNLIQSNWLSSHHMHSDDIYKLYSVYTGDNTGDTGDNTGDNTELTDCYVSDYKN